MLPMYVMSHTGCWLWTRYIARNGYGYTMKDRKWTTAHRIVWETFNGPIPKGMSICHTCDVRSCGNPAHLFMGTNDDNIRDKVSKRRQPMGEKHGQAKLNWEKVHKIRQIGTSKSQEELAEMFGVSPSAIFLVLKNINWKEPRP